MFLNTRTSNLFIHARVMTVDIKRQVCKCTSEDGHILSNVRWGYSLGQQGGQGSNDHPVIDEYVVLVNIKGEYLIFMSLSPNQTSEASVRSSISRGRGSSEFHNIFNEAQATENFRREGSSPEEMLPGDKIYTGSNGGLFGLLKGGTFIAKASGLAQIIVSRLDDVVRIVSRNYEMFSDAMAHYSINLRGRLYVLVGHFRNQKSSRQEAYDYYEVFGDVQAGNFAKQEYYTENSSLPAIDSLVKYQRIPAKDADGTDLGTRWLSTYDLDGKRVETSSTEANDIYAKVTAENGHWRAEIVNPTGMASIDVLPQKILISVHGCTIEQTPTTVIVTTTDCTLNTTTTTVNASTSATVNTPTCTIEASTTATVNAPTVNITGTSGDVVIQGISLVNHVHTSTPPGTPTTPPVP